MGGGGGGVACQTRRVTTGSETESAYHKLTVIVSEFNVCRSSTYL